MSPEVRRSFEDLLEAGTNAEYHFFRPAVYSSSAINRLDESPCNLTYSKMSALILDESTYLLDESFIFIPKGLLI